VALEHYGPPREAQIKTLLEGASAEQLQSGTYLVLQGKLTAFAEDGATNRVIAAPAT